MISNYNISGFSAQNLLLPLLLLLLLAWPAPLTAEESPPAYSGPQMAALMRPQPSGEFSARLRLEIRSAPAAGKPLVLQILVKGTRTQDASNSLWQIMYPKTHRGGGVLIVRHKGKPDAAYSYQPGGEIETIRSQDFAKSALGSDFSYEDLDQRFWTWTVQKDAGRTLVGKIPCMVLESFPGAGDTTSYGSIRSVIDLKRLVPLRIEKYTPNGKIARLIESLEIVKGEGGRFVPNKVRVASPARGTSTVMEASQLKEARYRDGQFKPAALLELTMP